MSVGHEKVDLASFAERRLGAMFQNISFLWLSQSHWTILENFPKRGIENLPKKYERIAVFLGG